MAHGLKPGHVLTETPNLYAQDIATARAAGWTLTAGETLPGSAKYVFTDAGPGTRFADAAQSIHAASLRRLAMPNGGHVTNVRVSPNAQVAPATPDIGVVLSCHPPYVRYLLAAVTAINDQTVAPAERYLALDGMLAPDLPAELDQALNGWEILESGANGSPCPGRNMALSRSRAQWLTFRDADDIMRPGWLADVTRELATVNQFVGIVYSDQIKTWDDGRTSLYTAPAPSYWELRRQNYISSHSLWRRRALIEAGGYKHTVRWDDWNAALDVTAAGWRLYKSKHPTAWAQRTDGSQRSKARTLDDRDDLWNFRQYSIVSLMAGRAQFLAQWRDWLAATDLPPHVELVVLDNSRDPAFASLLREAVESVQSRFGAVRMVRDNREPTPKPGLWDVYEHVAHLYNSALFGLQSDYVLTLEDDILPPLNGFRRLCQDYEPRGKVGAIGGLYRTRQSPDIAIGGTSHDYWHGRITMAAARSALTEVGFMGGGFTLWNAGCLHMALPCRIQLRPPDNPKPHGWDGNLCLDIRQRGYRLIMDGFVECEHFCGPQPHEPDA